MKVILTGRSGFLGNIIYNNLQNQKIITLGRTNSNIIADITKKIPRLPKCDLFIHCAGKAHFKNSSKRFEHEYQKVNVKGTQNILNSLKSNDLPEFFVFISSVSVYGLDSGNLINENHPLLANDPYGKSKIVAEKIVLEWCLKNNVICSILRLPLLVGVNPKGNLASLIHGIKKGYYFNISGVKAYKSMVLASDVAKNIIKISAIGGTFNLTDGENIDINRFSNYIARKMFNKNILDMPLIFAKIAAILGDVLGFNFFNSKKLKKLSSTLTFDDSLARKTFNWNPKSVLSQNTIFKNKYV